MDMDKKTQIEYDDLSDEAKKAIIDSVLDEMGQLLAPAGKDEEAEESEAAEDDAEDGEDAEDSEDAEEGDDEDAEEDGDDEDEEAEDDEDSEDSEDDEDEKSKKKGNKAKDADDEDEESEDEESEEAEDAEEDGDEDDVIGTVQGELDAIPESLFKQAKTESAAVAAKEAKTEMVDYFTRRGVDKKEAQAMVDGLKEKDLKSTYADYYARFLDTAGEVHDVDDPYRALRIVDGDEKKVWCCNGVQCENGKCVVNPKIKIPAKKDKEVVKGKGKKIVKKGSKK